MNLTTLKPDRIADAMNLLRAAKLLAIAEHEYARAEHDAIAFNAEYGGGSLTQDSAAEKERAFQYADALGVLVRNFLLNHC